MKSSLRSRFSRSIGMALAAAALMVAAGCSQIDTGNVGVSKFRGQTSLAELPAGNHITWFNGVDEFTTKEVSLPLQDLKPKSKDNLTMSDVDVDIYFQANPALVADTVVKYQGDIAKDKSGDYIAGHNRLSREAREAVFSAVAEFDATTMHTRRIDVAALVQKKLQAELDKTDKGVWTITSVNVVNLVTDPALEKSIRASAETDQQIARANKENELAKVNAAKLKIEAQGQADANQILSASLTPQLVRLKEIEAQRAFAGQGTHTVLMGGGAAPFINAGK